jgi:hypothetical protein
LRDPVDGGRDLLVLGAAEHADVERAGDPAVVPLLDRPHPPRAHHAEEAGIDEEAHVVRDRALGPVDHLRQLGERRGTPEDSSRSLSRSGSASARSCSGVVTTLLDRMS